MVTTACISTASIPGDEMPDIGIPESMMNTKIKLEAPDYLNSFTIGETIDLTAEVIANDQVAFAHDYGARMFIYEEPQWVEIANFMKYPDGYLVLTPSSDDSFSKYGAPAVDPILPDTSKPVTVRIILVGNIYRDGQITDEKTAAYIDVELKP